MALHVMPESHPESPLDKGEVKASDQGTVICEESKTPSKEKVPGKTRPKNK